MRNNRYRTWRQSRGRRLPAASYQPGFPIHVIIGVAGDRCLFEDLALATRISQPVATAEPTLAACLMPDHLHWLLQDAAAAAAHIRRMKSFTTRIAWTSGVEGRLWERSFYDRVLRRGDDVLQVARYIVANPVRAGLVEQPAAYRFSVLHVERIASLGWG